MPNSNTIRGTNNPNYRHGGLVYHKKEFNSWRAMQARCNDKNNHRYSDWGGRGITVCKRWDDFRVFLEDMGKKPSPDYSLDRIDNDGHYEPSNCRWSTRQEQALNKRIRSDNKSGHSGICWNKEANAWRVRVHIDGKRQFVGDYKTLEEAVKAKENAIIKA